MSTPEPILASISTQTSTNTRLHASICIPYGYVDLKYMIYAIYMIDLGHNGTAIVCRVVVLVIFNDKSMNLQPI